MHILTSVVGSYPTPRWLYGDASRVTLRDAIMVVLKTQELAGIDVVADGELNRFDPSHPETNGMIDYFVSRMDGIRTRFSIRDIDEIPRGCRARLPVGAGRDRGRAKSARGRSTCRAISNSPAR